MSNYQVIEDNAGGMFLFFFDGEQVTLALENIEHAQPGDLNGVTFDEAETWDSQLDDAQAVYEDITSHEFGWQVVADQNGVYPDRMGRAAELVYKIDID